MTRILRGERTRRCAGGSHGDRPSTTADSAPPSQPRRRSRARAVTATTPSCTTRRAACGAAPQADLRAQSRRPRLCRCRRSQAGSREDSRTSVQGPRRARAALAGGRRRGLRRLVVIPFTGITTRRSVSSHVSGVAEGVPARLRPYADPMGLVPNGDAVHRARAGTDNSCPRPHTDRVTPHPLAFRQLPGDTWHTGQVESADPTTECGGMRDGDRSGSAVFGCQHRQV
jgi:hypothetical protein